jgi:hypothetical protein
MPAAAFALNQYRRGALGVRTADNEQTTASLGQTEELSIQKPVRPPIAEVGHRTDELRKVAAGMAGPEALDVLEDEPPGAVPIDELEEGQSEA